MRRRLQALLEAARTAQRSDARAVDWTLEARPSRLAPRRFLSRAIGTLIAGEMATGAACRALAVGMAPGPARDCLELQANDETRHAVDYRRYLDRLGLAGDPPEGFAAATEAIENWRGPPEGRIVAVHVVLEAEALSVQRELEDDIACPLFTAVNRRVTRDEARHVAFGRLIAPAVAERLDEKARRETLAEIRCIWQSCFDSLAADSMLLRRAVAASATWRWAAQEAALARIGFAGP